MEQKEKSFKDCTLTFLEETFLLTEVPNLPALEKWLQTTIDISISEREHLSNLRDHLFFNVHHWNEHELDSKFIGPLFTFVDFSSMHFNHFAQREIAGIVEDYKLFGKPDGIIASGRREPKKPFFAFQEYKKQVDPDGDPAAQALAAMLVGQSLGTKSKPIYGSYVVGHDWWFMALNGKEYAMSRDYSAITDDIFDIFRILKALKSIVIELAAS